MAVPTVLAITARRNWTWCSRSDSAGNAIAVMARILIDHWSTAQARCWFHLCALERRIPAR
jgi:hypothetical protein